MLDFVSHNVFCRHEHMTHDGRHSQSQSMNQHHTQSLISVMTKLAFTHHVTHLFQPQSSAPALILHLASGWRLHNIGRSAAAS